MISTYFNILKLKPSEDECTSQAPRLPSSWNDTFGSHSFVYAHKQSAMTFVVKVDRLGNKVEVRGLAVGDDKIYRFERNIRDIVRSAGLPVRIPLGDAGVEDRSGLRDKLRQLFVSDQAIDGMINSPLPLLLLPLRFPQKQTLTVE
jgi:hypothetical protein